MVKEIIKSIDTHFAVRSSATSLCFSFLICKMRIIIVPTYISCILQEADTETESGM